MPTKPLNGRPPPPPPALPPRRRLGVDVFTTGQVARLLGVTPRTVSHIIDTAELPAVRVGRTPVAPQGMPRRVRRDDLLAYCEARGYDHVLRWLRGLSRCLCVGVPSLTVKCLHDALSLSGWACDEAPHLYAAAREECRVLLLGPLLPRSDVLAVADWLLGRTPRVVALLPDDADPGAYAGAGCVPARGDDPRALARLISGEGS